MEVAFRMDTVAGYQAIMGKDGKPLGDAAGEDNSPVPPFKVLIRGDDFPGGVPNQLFIEWIDGDGTLNSDVHFLDSGETVRANHVVSHCRDDQRDRRGPVCRQGERALPAAGLDFGRLRRPIGQRACL